MLGRATSCSISSVVLSMELSLLDVGCVTQFVDPFKFRLNSPPIAFRDCTCLFCNFPSIFQVSIVECKFPPSVIVADLLWVMLTAPHLLRFIRLLVTGNLEPSPGKINNFPTTPAESTSTYSVWVLDFTFKHMLILCNPLNSVFVHQVSVLSPASFRFHLTMDTLAFDYLFPPSG